MTEPRARIGLASAIALVVANMIGAGVFTSSGFALGDLGDRRLVMLAWLVGGVVALLGALSYGALALRWPESGGEYEYLRKGLHPAAGVVAGFVSMIAGFSAPVAAAAATFEQYFWDLAGTARPAQPWLATLLILSAAFAHGLRVELGARLQNGIVLVKAALIAVLLAAGAKLLFGDGVDGTLPEVQSSAAAFGNSLMWIYLAYSGWNASAYIASEVHEPRRNVPRAMLVGTLAVMATYLLLNAVFLWAVPARDLVGRAEVAAIAARALLDRPGQVLAASIVMLAQATSVTAMLMAGPRVYARMARDGALPALFADQGDCAPRRAIALQAALAIFFVWIAELQSVMSYIGWTLSICAAATVLGLMRTRLREGAAAVPCVGWPLVPGLFIALSVYFATLSFAHAPKAALGGLTTVAGGLVVATLMLRRR